MHVFIFLHSFSSHFFFRGVGRIYNYLQFKYLQFTYVEYIRHLKYWLREYKVKKKCEIKGGGGVGIYIYG